MEFPVNDPAAGMVAGDWDARAGKQDMELEAS